MIRTYTGAYLWPRRINRNNNKNSIIDILKEKECLVSVGIQRQGEGIALSPEGTSYYTHSEFVNQTIWKYDISSK